jgi:hypothetical protein
MQDGVPGALSRARQSLAAFGLTTADMTLNGETYLLDCSTVRRTTSVAKAEQRAESAVPAPRAMV